MWEAIRKNKRRSWLLIGLMGLLLLFLGWIIGSSLGLNWGLGSAIVGEGDAYADTLNKLSDDGMKDIAPGFSFNPLRWLTDPATWLNKGGLIGLAVAAAVWGMLTLFAFFQGDWSVLRSAGAHPIEKGDAPQLWNLVEEMTIASGLSIPPKVYLIYDDAPNAFAVGRDPTKATIAVTTGLIKRMNRDELQGVIAHEIAHIRNLDVRFMTLASVMVGSIVLISEMFLHSLWYGSSRRRSSSRGGGGGAQIVMLVIAILCAIIAPIIARLLYLACSRQREYLADACSARFTRFPEGLASALERLGQQGKSEQKVSRSLAPLFIVNPLQPRAASSAFSTHPPLDKRISVLRSMAGAGFADYEAAYRKIHGETTSCLNKGFVDKEGSIARRQATAKTKAKSRKDALSRAREAIDVIDRVAGLLLITCMCGARLKIPPEMPQSEFKCPRCGRAHETPQAKPVDNENCSDTSDDLPANAAMTYQRQGQGWESFRCRCGQTLQLSPKFSASHLSCSQCDQRIHVIEPTK